MVNLSADTETDNYQFDCTLGAEFAYTPVKELYGGTVHVTADLQTKTVFNTIYVKGEITIHNKTYAVSAKNFVLRSILGYIRKNLVFFGAMIEPDFYEFHFNFDCPEPELEEYNMRLGVSLSRNWMSLDVQRPTNSQLNGAYYEGPME